MKRLATILAIVTAVTGPALADLVTIGEATISNSWYQTFDLADNKNPQMPGQGEPDDFDRVGIRMVTGVLENPGMTSVSPSLNIANNVWLAGVLYNIVGTGAINNSNIATLRFTLNFEGSISDAVSFQVVTWDYKGNQWQASSLTTATWTGTTWTINDKSADLTTYGGAVDLDVVPLPAAAILGILGFGAAGMKLRRFV